MTATLTPPAATAAPVAVAVSSNQARPEEYERRVIGFFDEALR
jgi:hypothetical protein